MCRKSVQAGTAITVRGDHNISVRLTFNPVPSFELCQHMHGRFDSSETFPVARRVIGRLWDLLSGLYRRHGRPWHGRTTANPAHPHIVHDNRPSLENEAKLSSATLQRYYHKVCVGGGGGTVADGLSTKITEFLLKRWRLRTRIRETSC